MKKQLFGMLFLMASLCMCFCINVSAADTDALKAQQEYIKRTLEENQAAIDAQTKRINEVVDSLNNPKETKNTQVTLPQLTQLQDPLAMAANQQALEAVAAINAASAAIPQMDYVCDTNCADQNALLYSKTIPDFVLVDKSKQKVVFYRNGLRILADSCVTGNESKGYSTTVGIHSIVFMDTNRTLKGSYGTAFVRYWMRFTSGGQGLHDAGWRNRFGETIYVTNGSHGCVNLTRNTAKTIFENAYVGLPVIVEN